MNETDYHRFADTAINSLYNLLEKADANGSLDVDYQNGIMTVRVPSGQHYIINKHAVSRELWLSSPVSGGLHFRYQDGEWKLPEGQTLEDILLAELQAMTDVEMDV
jgi:frataxin